MRDLSDSAHGGPGIGCHSMALLHLLAIISSSRVWVHGTVIHHSWGVWVEFIFKIKSNEHS